MSLMSDYSLLGALFRTDAAAFAFILIYMGQQIAYLYCVFRTVLLTKTAAYAAGFALLHYVRPLIL